MSQPYVGEIRLFGGNFAPVGWAFCDGQLMPISENDTLFNLIGTTYGGDGQETFGLPDLRSRVPIHSGGGTYTIGQSGGAETVTLSVAQLPQHTHPAAKTSTGQVNAPTGAIFADATSSQTGVRVYANVITPNAATLNNASLTSVGGSQPHENVQPTLTVSYIISLFGIYPTQS